MEKLLKSQAANQVVPATVAYLNDVRNDPGNDYDYLFKVYDRQPEAYVFDYDKDGARKMRRDENGQAIKVHPPTADIEDLHILCVGGYPGYDCGTYYSQLDVYIMNDGGIHTPGFQLENYPQVKEALERAMKATGI